MKGVRLDGADRTALVSAQVSSTFCLARTHTQPLLKEAKLSHSPSELRGKCLFLGAVNCIELAYLHLEWFDLFFVSSVNFVKTPSAFLYQIFLLKHHEWRCVALTPERTVGLGH